MIDKDDFAPSPELQEYLDSKSIPLEYLDPFNKPAIEYQSY